MPDDQAKLQYQPVRPLRRRRRTNRIITFFVLLVAIWVGVAYFEPAKQHIQLLWWQHQCMHFEFPRGRKSPVYKCAPADNFSAALGVAYFGNLVFMHERRSPAGNRRLVAIHGIFFVTLDGMANISSPSFFPTVIVPGSILRKPMHVVGTGEHTPHIEMLGWITLLESQPDPDDPSHFTIVMQNTLNERFIVDGWLRDDDTVLLEPRDVVPIPPPSSLPGWSR